MNAERTRLIEAKNRVKYWKRWGPYLAERAWGNPREDYSADGTAWDYFTHDHARSRTYRWTEDGIAGICDNHQRLCFAFAFWNGCDPILKERLFGLSGPEGNHGEDVKEYYYYLDSTPTHSYMKYLYKYPQAEFPYAHLVSANAQPLAPMRRVRIDRHRDLRRGSLLRHSGRIRQARRRTTFWCASRIINRGPVAATLASAAHGLVSQYLELGLRHAAPELERFDAQTIVIARAVSGRIQAVARGRAAAVVHRKRNQYATCCSTTTTASRTPRTPSIAT